jgi:hypothetical protein
MGKNEKIKIKLIKFFIDSIKLYIIIDSLLKTKKLKEIKF